MVNNSCGCEREDIPPAEVAKTVDAQLASLDPHRAAAFGELAQVRSARASGYVREQKRLALKYGEDHPRVIALTQKISINNGLRRDVAFESARAATDAPTVDEKGYVFHGFVRDLTGQGIARLTVALYDANGGWIRELGYGCTDEQGYFLMRYPQGQAPADVKIPGTAAAADTAKRINVTATTTNSGSITARIYVLDANKTTLQIEPKPLQPQLGEVDFRIIILGATTGTCTPPPPQAAPAPTKPNEPAPAPTSPTRDTPKTPVPPVRETEATTSTPLENIRGVGKVRADKLRAAGIKDIETLLKTDPDVVVKIAGFDAAVIKREATEALKTRKEK